MKILNTNKTFKRLEKFWRDFVLIFPWSTDLKEAVMASYPKLPYYEPNHIVNINVEEEAFENLLRSVTSHFALAGSPTLWIRVSPLTCLKSFTSFLEESGFKQDFETSVMTFEGSLLKDLATSKIRIEEVSKRGINCWKELVCSVFGVPYEWREGFSTYVDAYVKGGGRCYLAYIEDKPVGTCSLLSMNGSGGIFTVGTLKEFRRRGVGTALTLHALNDSFKEGNTLHLLYVDKGDYAEHLYKRIGFEIHHTVTWFIKEI